MATEKRPSVEEILASQKQGTVEKMLDSLLRRTATGQVSTAIGDNFYGINHRQQPGAISINKDYYGLTFFTRPRLNLTEGNLRAVRLLTPLLNQEAASIQRIIRCLLDPQLAQANVTSPFVDRQQAFIPILTNNLLSINGWPDVLLPINTSQAGMYKEAWSQADGVAENFSTYQLTAAFRNLPGDPITALFLNWVHYASNVYQGTMVPYPDMIVQNEIDYQTRIYRLVLDSSKSRVQKIGACGAAFPVNAPIGAAFNYEADRPINNSNDQITIQFECAGAMYQDDILVDEFNRTVAMFNDQMAASRFTVAPARNYKGELYLKPQNKDCTQIPMDALTIFNNRGYPRIDPETYELQWWVDNDDYRTLLPLYEEHNQVERTTP